MWSRYWVAALVCVLGFNGSSRADIITFDDVPAPAGVPLSWDYNGVNFSSGFFQGVWTGQPGANNGTPSFISGFSTTTISMTDGSPFNLQQFDIGLTYFTLPNDTVQITENYVGGGSSSFFLPLDQTFQTLNLNGTNLTSVQISTPLNGAGYIAIDNLEISAVPEPTTLAVFGLMGVAGAGYVRRRMKAVPTA